MVASDRSKAVTVALFLLSVNWVGQWSHSLFGCFDNFGTCIITYVAPCVTFGQTAETIGEGSCLLCGAVYFVPILNLFTMANIRGKIREMKGIDGSFINDCIAVICCHFCALVQEHQEVSGSPSAMSMARE